MGAPFGQIGPFVIVDHPPVNRMSRDDVEAINWFPVEIDPTALLEAGVIVHYGDTRPTVIGPRVWLGCAVIVTHDVQIGEDSEVMHGSVIGGYVTIGERVRIGMNATLKPRVTVGDDAVIGMGAVVTHDVPAGETWAGNPARNIRDERRDEGLDEWRRWWDNSRRAVPSETIREWPAAP